LDKAIKDLFVSSDTSCPVALYAGLSSLNPDFVAAPTYYTITNGDSKTAALELPQNHAAGSSYGPFWIAGASAGNLAANMKSSLRLFTLKVRFR
jgi:hypothetical protein